MRIVLAIFVAALLISGCSKKPQYVWQAQAGSYFLNYQALMFQGDSVQALYYFDQAVAEAKKGATLKPLADLYLGACAIEQALFRDTNCTGYETIGALDARVQKASYEGFIKAKTLMLDAHTKNYEAVIEALHAKDVREMLKAVTALETVAAQSIAASVIERLGFGNVALCDAMIDIASKESMPALMRVWMEKKLGYLDVKDVEHKALKAHIRLLSIR